MKNFFSSKTKAVQRIVDQTWFYPIVLLFVGLAAYGIILTHPGFYWDDWESVYLYYLHPALNISIHYFGARPFAVLPHLLMFPFFKMTPIIWEFISLILRWLGILFIYFTLDSIWPKRVWQNKWIGVLLFVFPGYLSQPVSVTFSRQLMTFLFFACSLFLTVLAIKNRKFFWLFISLSVVLGILQIFMMEYFVLLEIIRPLIIWFTLRSQPETKKTALSKTVLYWLPFAIGLGVYFWWRLVYIPTVIKSDPNSPELISTILSSPISGLKTLIKMVVQDTGNLLMSIWAGTLALDKFNIFYSKIAGISWVVGIVAAVLSGAYIRRSHHDGNETEDRPFLQMLILGIVALMAGAFPIWATGRYIVASKWSDRFTLGPMLGVVILLVYVLDWLLRTHNQKQWLLSILLASSISLQVVNTNKFRIDWANQQGLYWQLSWRIPNLKPGTAIIGSGTFTDKSSFQDGKYIVDLLFSKRLAATKQYMYFDIWHLPAASYKPNLPLTYGKFIGSTSQAVGMYFNINNPNECVRILDQVYKGDPNFNEGIRNIIPISNLDEISVGDTSNVPNPDIFGTEPSHTWCYFFEKADLARQMKDWKTVLHLGTEAEAKSFVPFSGGEYLPFIEAFAQTGQWSKANDLSLAAQKITPGFENVLCNNWGRFKQIIGGQDKDLYLEKANVEFCSKATSK
jgi:hypothetical protein